MSCVCRVCIWCTCVSAIDCVCACGSCAGVLQGPRVSGVTRNQQRSYFPTMWAHKKVTPLPTP